MLYARRSKPYTRKSKAIQCTTCKYQMTVEWKDRKEYGCTRHNVYGERLAKPPVVGCKWYSPEAKEADNDQG